MEANNNHNNYHKIRILQAEKYWILKFNHNWILNTETWKHWIYGFPTFYFKNHISGISDIYVFWSKKKNKNLKFIRLKLPWSNSNIKIKIEQANNFTGTNLVV